MHFKGLALLPFACISSDRQSSPHRPSRCWSPATCLVPADSPGVNQPCACTQERANVAVKFLPLIDNLERALSSQKPKTPGEAAVHDMYQSALGGPLHELLE